MKKTEVAQIDQYEIQKCLNDKKNSHVYLIKSKTQQKNLIKKQFLKQFYNQKNPQFESVFLSMISHPGIIELIDQYQNDKLRYLVLQYCPNGNLRGLMRSFQGKRIKQFLHEHIFPYILAQIIEVLDFLHSKGITHCDIKPQNFVISSEMKLKLIDFADIKFSEHSELFSKENYSEKFQTRIKGSPHYLSPQAYNPKNNLDFARDIWAFGVIAFELYHDGKFPYEGNNSHFIGQSIKKGLLIDYKLPKNVQELILLTLQKDPLKRLSARDVKKLKYFKNVDFDIVYAMESPLKKLLRKRSEDQKSMFSSVVNLVTVNEKKKYRKLQILQNQKMQGSILLYSKNGDSIKREIPYDDHCEIILKEGGTCIVQADQIYTIYFLSIQQFKVFVDVCHSMVKRPSSTLYKKKQHSKY